MSDFKKLVANLTAALGETAARQKLGKAVYLFSFGGNDYISFYSKTAAQGNVPSNITQINYIKGVIGNITAALKVRIYEIC